ncbi:YdcH family protein [Halorhodospira neutriphila]|uniref:GTP-binding protein n=1 Tax=Halorhodospira neutriphila TaxID=168379 RepID=A0ABS1E8M3_9GAMM|nr:YdcH family protein [Halorhodospira neutriphila]MBK1727402.1 GTP-binding protein [Halorhodospira neutriphila]
MLGDHHGLAHEFPDYRERIHELKMADAHFRNLMEQYDEVNTHVERLEQQGEPVDDATLEDLKKQRLQLKDQIYSYLTQAQ